MGKKKTHEEYVTEVAKINQMIVVIGTYVDAKTSILHRCLVDGYEWLARPDGIMHGKGCPKCGRASTLKSIKKTHEQYIADVAIINPNIEVIEEYIDAKTKILHKCNIDGHEWLATPNGILNGCGCPVCGGKIKLTHDCFIDRMKKVNDNIEIIGIYVNYSTPIKCICKIDGYEWYASPSNLLQGKGCPMCGGTKHKTHNEYVKDVFKINKNILVLGTYINVKTPILHKCLIDGHEWYAKPNNILSGKGCPKCNESHGEKQIYNYLNDHHIVFDSQHTFSECKNEKLLPFDFYLVDYNICIEYDGIQHFEPVEVFGGQIALAKQQHNDSIKTTYCNLNNIQLLRIRYDQDVKLELDKFFNNTKLIREAI